MSTFTGLSDANLTALCLANGTSIDPNCACLLSGGGPELNTDISGPGVRISFYLQALFLALLAARSGSLEEISGALYTLIATNVSMAITSLILGFKTHREMSLHDAIVVLYLLAGSWLAIFFSLPSYNRFVKSDATLQVLTVVHSFIIFAFILAVLVTARTFGSTPRCNTHAVAVIFFHFPALNTGRISAFVFVCLVICVYSFLSLSDYYRVAVDEYHKFRKRQKPREEKAEKEAQLGTMSQSAPGTLVTVARHLPDMERGFPVPGPSRPTFASSYEANAKVELDERLRAQINLNPSNKKKRKVKERYYMTPKATSKAGAQREHNVFITGLLGSLLIEVVVIVVLWALFVMNTELLILWNRFDGGGDGLSSDLWGFGQILPMFLVLLPFVQLSKAFMKWKLRRREHRTQRHRRGLTTEEKAAKRARRYAERHGYAQGHGHRYGHGNGHSHTPPGGMGWMPQFFFQGAAGASAHPFGNQPFAHISVDSIHSEKIALGPSREGEGDEEAGSRRSAESKTTSSSFSISTSSASSSVPSLTDGCATVAGEADLGVCRYQV